jgi:two-component system KDP operon response regulator KdpE
MWNEPTRLLLIDDDERLTSAVALYMRRQGFELDVAHDGHVGLERFIRTPPDLVVLDVMMPGMDGWEVCRRIRERSNVPIIMLTARTDENDRVLGLRLGADDYVAKPFSLKELEARIEAVIRRANMEPPTTDDLIYDDGRLRIERGAMQVSYEDEPVNLTATERRLLFTLAENAGRVLSPDQILRQVWGPEYAGQSDYVKLYIWRVRQKIEPTPGEPTYIQTERGLGYRFVAVKSESNGRSPRPVAAEAHVS